MPLLVSVVEELESKPEPVKPLELDLRRLELIAIKAWLMSVYPRSILRRLKRINSEKLRPLDKAREWVTVELPEKLDQLVRIARRISRYKLERELSEELEIICEIFDEAERVLEQTPRERAVEPEDN